MNKFLKLEKLIKEKLMVIPSKVTILQKDERKRHVTATYYKANGIHKVPDDDKFFPTDRELGLFAPLSASRKSKKSMLYETPEQIEIEKDGKSVIFFKLNPVQDKKAIKNLSKEEKKYFSQYLDLEDEDQERCLDITKTMSIYLPLTDKNKILTRDFFYEDVVKCLARDIYWNLRNEFSRTQLSQARIALETRKAEYTQAKKGKDSSLIREKSKEVKLAQEHLSFIEDKDFDKTEEAEVMNKAVSFIKKFDAFEIGYDGNVPPFVSYVGVEGMDPKLNYENYNRVIFYQIPCKTKDEKEIARKIAQQVQERKNEILVEKVEKKQVSKVAEPHKTEQLELDMAAITNNDQDGRIYD